jgi:hypothetical protein
MANFETKAPAQTYIATSTLKEAGQGLFAKSHIKRHQFLGVYPGAFKLLRDIVEEDKGIRLFDIAAGR